MLPYILIYTSTGYDYKDLLNVLWIYCVQIIHMYTSIIYKQTTYKQLQMYYNALTLAHLLLYTYR